MNICSRCDGLILSGNAHAEKEDCIQRLQDQIKALMALVAALKGKDSAHEAPADFA